MGTLTNFLHLRDSFTSPKLAGGTPHWDPVALGHPINLDRINRPLKDVVVDKNVRDVWYISCKIDGVQQLRKNLSPADRDTYLYRKLNCNNEYYSDELTYQMAEKYYANEIDLAQSQTNNRGRGR